MDTLLDEKDITAVYIYSKGLEFPVMIAERGEWDKTQISFLNLAVHTTKSLVQWCDNHGIIWKIIYPVRRFSWVKNPVKYIRYRVLMCDLRRKTISR